LLQKFVYVTGAFDFLVGIASWVGALADPQPAFVGLMTLGMFLFMAAACLMWASKDMKRRAPVIFWQGLVRLMAVGSMLYAIPAGLAETWGYGLVVFDGLVGLTYVIGMMRVTGCTLIELLCCKTEPGGAAVPAQ